jgi:hypothetical protein
MGDVADAPPEESQSGTAVFEEECGMKGIMRLICVLVIAGLTAGGAGATKAEAGLLTCAQSPEQPFAAWGDYSPYTLAPNGSLEQGSSGWSLSGGASIIASNNTYRSGSYSLSLPSGSSATLSNVCVRLSDDRARFFVRNTGNADAILKVEITYRTVLGLLPLTETLGYVKADGTWDPSPKFGYLANVVGVLALDGGLGTHVKFKFTARGWGGRFQVDDLFVDPIVQF